MLAGKVPLCHLKKFRKGGVTRPGKLWLLNANSSKMAKDTNFKFGMRAQTGSRDMTPKKFSNRGRG